MILDLEEAALGFFSDNTVETQKSAAISQESARRRHTHSSTFLESFYRTSSVRMASAQIVKPVHLMYEKCLKIRWWPEGKWKVKLSLPRSEQAPGTPSRLNICTAKRGNPAPRVDRHTAEPGKCTVNQMTSEREGW